MENISMSQSYFVQDCPTCGRALRIRVQYLGKTLNCVHCRGKLEALDPENSADVPATEGLALLRRANELLGESRIA